MARWGKIVDRTETTIAIEHEDGLRLDWRDLQAAIDRAELEFGERITDYTVINEKTVVLTREVR